MKFKKNHNRFLHIKPVAYIYRNEGGAETIEKCDKKEGGGGART